MLGEVPALDAVIVGVGPDGHVCSLFPGHPALHSDRWVEAISDSPKPPPERLTLTMKTLQHARLLLFAVAGEAKAQAVQVALEDPGSTLPAAIASRSAPSIWFLDEAAASGLSPSTRRK